MDSICVTPRKVVLKSDILNKCIECSGDVSNEKGVRRLACNFRDTLIEVDCAYKDIFLFLEAKHMLTKAFICKKCTMELKKYIDMGKEREEIFSKIKMKMIHFKEQFVTYKRGSKLGPLPNAKDSKYRRIAANSPSKLPVPVNRIHVPTGSEKVPKKLFADPVSICFILTSSNYSHSVY